MADYNVSSSISGSGEKERLERCAGCPSWGSHLHPVRLSAPDGPRHRGLPHSKRLHPQGKYSFDDIHLMLLIRIAARWELVMNSGPSWCSSMAEPSSWAAAMEKRTSTAQIISWIETLSWSPSTTDSALSVTSAIHGRKRGGGWIFPDCVYRPGFLSTEDGVAPGNYGLLDQSLALRWFFFSPRLFLSFHLVGIRLGLLDYQMGRRECWLLWRGSRLRYHFRTKCRWS